MQASKPLTPVKSKPAPSKDSQVVNLAQRVMEVTISPEQLQPPATSNKSAFKKPLVSTSGSDNNSIESSVNDHEVESITNRANNKIESGSSSVVANSGPVSADEKRPRVSPASSSLLLLTSSSNISATQCQKAQQQQPTRSFHHQHHRNAHNGPLVGQTHQLKSHEAEVRSANDLVAVELDQKSSGPAREPTISLDTKVPHPASNIHEEEVSYYNDAQANTLSQATTITNLLEPKQMGGSLDNHTKPRLLAAVASSQQQQTHHHHQNVNHQKQQQQLQHRQQLRLDHQHRIQQQQQASLVSTSTSCQHLLRNNPYINDDEQTDRQQGDEDDDEDLLRYDNAQVERNLEAQRQSEHQLMLVGGGSSNRQRHNQQQHQQQQQTGQRHVSISTSPKAKSAPATPCNVTPTAFHQSSSNLNSMMANPNCNTLPPDIRKNISATCRVLPSSLGADVALMKEDDRQQVNLKYLDSLSERGERALQEKDYALAIELLSQCISLANQQQLLTYLKRNFKVYSQRAEAHLKLANYNEAIDDSMAARGLNPKWTQAYYLQGKAQFRIGQYADALAVFAFGLTQQDSSASSSLFEALVEAASSYSPDSFKSKFHKLKSLKLDTKPFVVVGLLGQELFATGHNEHAAIVLESALKIDNSQAANDHSASSSSTNQHKKFKSSVLSTISAAYCKLRDYDKALSYMQRELDIETELEDIAGQCRVLANLGYAFFKVRQFDKSLEVHRKQLNLAMKLHLFQQASQAFNALGHVHVARNNYTDALTSHERCLLILKQLGDNYLSQFREVLAIGHIYSQLGDLKAAETNYNEALNLLKSNNKQLNASERDEMALGSIMVNFNLAYLALMKQSYSEAEHYYNSVLKLTKSLNQTGPTSKRLLYEMRASNGLGQTCRLMKRFDEAQGWFEEQLQLAKTAQCKLGQSQALCNLGMIQQHFKNYQKARHLFEENLKLADKSAELKAYAHSYLGSTYFLMGCLSEAKIHYETSLNLFRELGFREAERKTIEANLAAIRERVNGANVSQQSLETLQNPTNSGKLTNGSQTLHSKKVMISAS